MKKEKWGPGNRTKEKAFDNVSMKSGEMIELFHGEHPHSRQDNTTYARTKTGKIYPFSGHRLPFKIEIEQYNYLKQSGLSGDEIRKGGKVKLFLDGIQIFEDFCRSYESGFMKVQQFIIDMEEHWSWYPKHLNEWEDKIIMYHDQKFKIQEFIVSQACMILKTVDGKKRKLFPYEEKEDSDEISNSIKVEITSSNIWWYPK